MLTPTETAWLAGFMDADGCIRLKKGAKNSNKSQHSLIPHMTFHNTCVVTLNRVVYLLTKARLPIKTYAKKRRKVGHSEMGNVELLGMKQCEPLLRLLLPFLVTKRLEARLLLQFIVRRKRPPFHKPFSEMDYKANAALKYLKVSRHLRDYTPKIGDILDQDIVRTNAKALEGAEMSSRFSQAQLNERASKLVWYRWDKSKAIKSIA